MEFTRKHIQALKDVRDVQGMKGNYDTSPYMLGLYNGMECMIALLERREPIYRSCKNFDAKTEPIIPIGCYAVTEPPITEQEQPSDPPDEPALKPIAPPVVMNEAFCTLTII